MKKLNRASRSRLALLGVGLLIGITGFLFVMLNFQEESDNPFSNKSGDMIATISINLLLFLLAAVLLFGSYYTYRFLWIALHPQKKHTPPKE